MICGFAAAATGDWFLAVKASPVRSPGFLAGIACFAAAHALWMAGQLKEARPDLRVIAAAAIPLLSFACVRLAPVLPPVLAAAVVAYTAVSAVGLSVAAGGRRLFYSLGILLLVFSDVMIGARMLRAPGCGQLVGPFYVTAEILLLVSCFRSREPRLSAPRRPFGATVAFGAVSAAAFLAAMAAFPGGGYNPLMRMLSALGRTAVRGVAWPWCHYLFVAGMLSAAAGSATAMLSCRRLVAGARLRALEWGAALNFAGLLTIAAVPENVNMLFHNAGCWMAAIGGGMALVALDRRAAPRSWTVALLSVVAVFGAAVALHALHAIPFVPAVPTMQKALIVSFIAWLVRIAWPFGSAASRRAAAVVGAALLLIASLHAAHAHSVAPDPAAWKAPDSAAKPLSADERAALRWLERVTGELPPDEERDWWETGGSQHGLFAKRYGIAFAGYAAAALGMRGDDAQWAAAGRILGRCVERYLKRDVWAYSMSRSYWGLRPWAPDPCFRENVMYTGHLLQLLAFYEAFTGDRRYWTHGFDFVWTDGRIVHYNVQKLVDVTVHQMRHGPNGGVTCEPGLMFFPCNNHPHVALAVFAKLGHGDWSEDARRWERWALGHYAKPLLGGGALNLVYHVRSGAFYPRGSAGLDAWSLLWYEPWAADRGTALALWRAAAEKVDWTAFADPADEVAGRATCCDPAKVPPTVAASFLAAAARECGDSKTAERLEGPLDAKFLRRDGGMYWLALDREWRVGASTNRIIALAIANGSSFRALCGRQ
ncbi:MAG: hypothetical protein IKE55_06505 [Kiritimatiellae bacterium]|nr:hypothetical protein [Kiritimatiellia bacterium]